MEENKENKGDLKINVESIIRLCTTVIKEVGFLGFILIFAVLLVIIWATENQKQAIIDKYILIKDVEKNPFPFILIVLALIVIIILQGIYYRAIIKREKREIIRLSGEKKRLQKDELGKGLTTSGKE